MGMPSDFFVASQQELRALFRGWAIPLDAPVMRDVGFGAEYYQALCWHPGTNPSMPDLPDLRTFNDDDLYLAEFVNIDLVGYLCDVVTACGVEEARTQLSRPALVADDSGEVSLHELPMAMIARLSEAPKDVLAHWASEWRDRALRDPYDMRPSEEYSADIVLNLHRLAQRASMQNKSVYVLMTS